MDIQEKQEIINELTPKNPYKKILGIIFIAIILFIAGSFLLNNKKEETDTQEEKIKISVGITDLSEKSFQNYIETVGVVKPDKSVDVVTLSRGNILNIYFEKGDYVSENTLVADLYDQSALINYSNAYIAYLNMQNSLLDTENLTQEGINQAQLGLLNAQNTISGANINLEAAKTTYKNTLTLQEKNNIDLKNNAIIFFNAFINTVLTSQDQINFIISAEGANHLDNIDKNLAITNPQSLIDAKLTYFEVKKLYNNIKEWNLNTENIHLAYQDLLLLLEKEEKLSDLIISVLDSTVPYKEFNENALNTQRSIYFNLRNSIISANSNAKSIYDQIINLPILNNLEKNQVETSLNSAKKQLEQAELSYKNAESMQANSKANKTSQVNSVKSALDNTKGQLDIIQNTVNNLNVYAPISGIIIQKFAETGYEVNPGQKIMQIAQTDIVKISADISSDEIYKIKVGDEVLINDTYLAIIEKIAPSADPQTRKVNIEIFYDNKNNDLIPETFVNIKIQSSYKKTQGSIFIPLNALIMGQNENYVFTEHDDKAVKTIVKIGEVFENSVEIIEGLSINSKLITENNKQLQNGDEIIY